MQLIGFFSSNSRYERIPLSRTRKGVQIEINYEMAAGSVYNGKNM